MASYSLFLKKYSELKKDYNVKIYSKDLTLPWFWILIHWFLFIVSFGKTAAFMSNSVITIGNNIFFYSGWRIENATMSDYVALCHEGDHVGLVKKLGLGSILLGTFIFVFLYLFVPLPIGLSWFRYAIERRAYRVTYLTWKELGKAVSYKPYIKMLTGPSYLWAWPFKKSVRKWFEKNCN